MLGNLIGGFIVILVGTSLLPTVANSVVAMQNNSNITSGTGGEASSVILGLTTLFYSLSIMLAGVVVAGDGLRNSGLI